MGKKLAQTWRWLAFPVILAVASSEIDAAVPDWLLMVLAFVFVTAIWKFVCWMQAQERESDELFQRMMKGEPDA